MAKTNSLQGNKVEELLAEVAAAAHRATSHHGFKGAFIDVELDLWYALQAKMRRISVPEPVENTTNDSIGPRNRRNDYGEEPSGR